MCTFNNQIKESIVTGYKLAVQDKYNHYYSPVTGVRYEVGKVKAAKKYGKHNVRNKLQFNDVLTNKDGCFDPRYTGMTAIFKSLNAARDFKEYCLFDNRTCNMQEYKTINKKLVILKMKLSGILYHGTYSNEPVYIGSEIKSIKKIKQ